MTRTDLSDTVCRPKKAPESTKLSIKLADDDEWAMSIQLNRIRSKIPEGRADIKHVIALTKYPDIILLNVDFHFQNAGAKSQFFLKLMNLKFTPISNFLNINR